jgi:hypothetical protein
VSIHLPISFVSSLRRRSFPAASSLYLFVLLCLLVSGSGCKRFHHMRAEKVYVAARQTYLHDRVAAVSNRVAQVANGQELEVMERGRRFLRVKTEKNEIGWIEERSVIDSKTRDQFTKLADQHKQEPVVATATLRDDLYVHLQPGRDTEHFYLLAGNTKVQLLARASVVKTAPGSYARPATSAQPAATPAKGPAPSSAAHPGTKPPAPAAQSASAAQPEVLTPPPPVMEDWWLARDSQGHTGWLLGNRLDVDVPDEIGTYAEGQRIVGAYVLTKVTDPEASTSNHEIPEYLTVLAPPKSGLPFDFDQVRVFTWSMKHHRYETAYRLHGLQGYLPVRLSSQTVANRSVPVFSFVIDNDRNVYTDSATGIIRPSSPRTINFALIDTQVKRIGPDMGAFPDVQSPEDKAKAMAKAKAKAAAQAARAKRR